jgi:metal-responsive CopG/Arc/MetJ family transcriptional regulator
MLNIGMERTTIYLDESLKRSLLELSAEESKKKGKRIGMAEMIREAIIEYLKERDKPVKNHDTIERMLSTKGRLGRDYEKRVKELQREFKKWKIKSV